MFYINKSDIEDGHYSDKDLDYHQPIGVDGMYIFYNICILYYNN